LPNIHGGIQKNVQQCINRSCTVHIRQNKLCASWGCIFYCRMATPRCKVLHRAVAVQQCKIHRQLAPSLFCLICTVQLPK